jgi:PhoPQ-activated pathogenicity-related protein
LFKTINKSLGQENFTNKYYKTFKEDWSATQVVECLPNKHEVLNSIPSTTKKRKALKDKLVTILHKLFQVGESRKY